MPVNWVVVDNVLVDIFVSWSKSYLDSEKIKWREKLLYFISLLKEFLGETRVLGVTSFEFLWYEFSTVAKFIFVALFHSDREG